MTERVKQLLCKKCGKCGEWKPVQYLAKTAHKLMVMIVGAKSVWPNNIELEKNKVNTVSLQYFFVLKR